MSLVATSHVVLRHSPVGGGALVAQQQVVELVVGGQQRGGERRVARQPRHQRRHALLHGYQDFCQFLGKKIIVMYQ